MAIKVEVQEDEQFIYFEKVTSGERFRYHKDSGFCYREIVERMIIKCAAIKTPKFIRNRIPFDIGDTLYHPIHGRAKVTSVTKTHTSVVWLDHNNQFINNVAKKVFKHGR